MSDVNQRALVRRCEFIIPLLLAVALDLEMD